MIKDNKRDKKYFFIFIALFSIIWTLYLAFIYPKISVFHIRSYEYAFLNLLIRLSLWLVPVILYIKIVEKENVIEYLKLNKFSFKAFLYILIGIGTFVSLYFFQIGVPVINSRRFYPDIIINVAIVAAFVEEILFRGFIYQKLQTFMNDWVAIIISSLLFLAVHFPAWALQGSFSIAFTRNAASVFVSSIFIGIIFKYTKSLWPPVVVHTVNNIIGTVIWY